MKQLKRLGTKQFIFLSISFIILLTNYTSNVWGIVDSQLFSFYERQPEALVIGRLIRSQQESIFSKGGLTGLNYDANNNNTPIELLPDEYSKSSAQQHDIYLNQAPMPANYVPYKSQSGGQGIVFGIIQSVSPLSNANNLKLFRLINATLITLCFIIFVFWVCRHFGMLSGAITFLCILFSPWLTIYAHNLWWVVWSFYLPFLTILLLLEKRMQATHAVSNTKICVFVFIAVFTKCFFSGFEFITTTLISMLCPIVYYYVLQNKKLWEFIKFSFIIGATALLAVVTQMSLLVLQIASLEGNWNAGIDHILESYVRRAGIATQEIGSIAEVIGMYLLGDIWVRDLTGTAFGFFHFGIAIFIILLFCLAIHRLNKKKIRKNTALIYTTLFSFLAPLSWFIIFKEHAYYHSHIDYFVWYLPTFLLGFATIAQGISILVGKIILPDRRKLI